METVDSRGLNCPEPLLKTMKALEENSVGVVTIVDNEIPLENIIRFARNNELKAEWEKRADGYWITISGNYSPKEKIQKKKTTPQNPVEEKILLITANTLGKGSEELGQLLMKNFIFTLTRNNVKPACIIFINSGVKLCATGSPVVDDLAMLESAGVNILSCGTCVDYFSLKNNIEIGKITNIYDITDFLMNYPVITV